MSIAALQKLGVKGGKPPAGWTAPHFKYPFVETIFADDNDAPPRLD